MVNIVEDKSVVLLPFSGFYGSVHEEQIDYVYRSMFTDWATGCELNEPLYEYAFDDIDWPDVYEAYAKEFVDALWEITDIQIEFESVQSPKYYNFTTDRVFGYIKDPDLLKMLQEVERNTLDSVCCELFTSRSGFISHYNPDYREWGTLDEWDHNQLGALFVAWLKTKNLYAEVTGWFLEDSNGEIDEFISNAGGKKLERALKIHSYLNKRAERLYYRTRAA